MALVSFRLQGRSLDHCMLLLKTCSIVSRFFIKPIFIIWIIFIIKFIIITLRLLYKTKRNKEKSLIIVESIW